MTGRTIMGALGLVLGATCAAPRGATGQDRRPRAPDWQVSLGMGGFSTPAYAGSAERRTLPLPLVTVAYRGRVHFPVGAGLGVSVIRTPTWTWSVSASGTLGRPESRADGLAGMGDRPFGIGTGSTVTFRRGVLHTSMSFALGLKDDAGTTAAWSAGASGRLTTRAFGTIGGTLTWADRKSMRYDFGVTPSQAAARQALVDAGDPRMQPTDVGPFFPAGGLKDIAVHTSLGYAVDAHWNAIGFAAVQRLTGDAARSPLTERRTSVSGGVGVSYRF